MSARLRKKKLYRNIFNVHRFKQPLAASMMRKYCKGWRVIEVDVLRLFGNDRLAAWNWFISPAIAFGGRRPADLVAAGSVQVVREHMIRLEYGVYV